MPEREEPTFVFAHLLATHPPYVFDADGSYLPVSEVHNRSEKVNYVKQLIFINGEVEALIDELLSRSKVPPIIVLQADEGPLEDQLDFSSFKWQEASEAQLREKMRILNAYYLPNANTSGLYPSISPVNSFRLIFDLYFGADFALLPDKSYAYSVDRPYDFFDVTDKVKYQ